MAGKVVEQTFWQFRAKMFESIGHRRAKSQGRFVTHVHMVVVPIEKCLVLRFNKVKQATFYGKEDAETDKDERIYLVGQSK